MFEEIGNDERWLLKCNDEQKLLYQLILFTVYMSNGTAPDDPRYYQVRYHLHRRIDRVTKDLKHIKSLFPKLLSKDKKLSLLNYVGYENRVATKRSLEVEREVEQEREVEEELNTPPPSAQSLQFFDNLVKETTKGIGTVKPENPKAVDLKDVVVKHGDQELGEPAKHKLHNSLIKLFDNRGWNPKLIKSVMRSCAEKLVDADPNGDIYPYYEKIICKYVNENADLLAAENKKMARV